MVESPSRLIIIACGALANEILAIIRLNNWQHVYLECLPAELHNTPDKITAAVRAKINDCRRRGHHNLVVVYSDCGTGGNLQRMLATENVPGIGGAHCYQLFAGHDRFAAINDSNFRTFYLTDFLARHFDTLVYKGLGLDRLPQLINIYFANYERVVYLAQSHDEELIAKARAAAVKLGLKLEIVKTGYGYYEDFLTKFVTSHQID